MTYRPGGVTALAIIFIIMAVLVFVGAIAIWTSVISSYYASLYNLLFNIYSSQFVYGTNLIDALVGSLDPLSTMMDNISRWNTFGGITAIFLGLYLLSGIGLLEMKKWGYYFALMTGILSIIGGVIGGLILGLNIIGLIPVLIGLIFGIPIVVYLVGDVKYEFQ